MRKLNCADGSGLMRVLLPLWLLLSLLDGGRGFWVILAAVAIVLCLPRAARAHAMGVQSPLTLATAFYALLLLASSLWARFGLYAANEAFKPLLALAGFALCLSWLRRENLRFGLYVFCGLCTVLALLAVDALSLHLLSNAVVWAANHLLGGSYQLEKIAWYEPGVRIAGLSGNANISAGTLALGLCLGLHLLRSAAGQRERLVAALMLGVQALAFLLMFSMGACISFALGCLIYWLCTARGQRLSLLLLMAACVLTTALCAGLANPCLDAERFRPEPMLLALVNGGAIWALDSFVTPRLCRVLAGQGKRLGIALGCAAALCLAYGLAACSLTGPAALSDTVPLKRAAYLSGGDYVLDVSGDGDAAVYVYSESTLELSMHSRSDLYAGPARNASFAVPEDARVVFFEFTGSGTLRRAALSDGTELKLNYRLAPEFLVSRLQGLWANANVAQRLVFFRDGLRVWRQSPIIGLGLGCVEGQLTAVQEYYYETKYIHDHFIQVMDEAGVLGLLSFAAVLLCAVLTLRRRKAEDGLFPPLCAVLCVMVAHSVTEVVWSDRVYLLLAFFALALMAVQYAPEPAVSRGLQRGGLAASLAALLVFTGLLGNAVLVRQHFVKLGQGANPATFLSDLERLDRRNIYRDPALKATRMANLLRQGDTAAAARCARQLTAMGSFEACGYAAAYYYLPVGDLEAYFAALHTGVMQEASNRDAWNVAVEDCRRALPQLPQERLPDFVQGVAAEAAFLEEFNRDRVQAIVLDGENEAFFSLARSLVDFDGADALLWELLSPFALD